MPISRETEQMCSAVMDAMLFSRDNAKEILPAMAGTLAVFVGTITTSHENCLDMVDALHKVIRQIATDTFVKAEALRAKANAGAPSVLAAYGTMDAGILAASDLPGFFIDLIEFRA